MNTPNFEEQLSYEQAIQRLEEILREMEAPGLPLERALQLYESGKILVHYCRQKLSQAELRIQQIHDRNDTTPTLTPFATREDPADQ
jgi:exodeoxyribonuclease VII small subunit